MKTELIDNLKIDLRSVEPFYFFLKNVQKSFKSKYLTRTKKSYYLNQVILLELNTLITFKT